MADKFLIKGGIPLKGDIEISGYKNSAGACLSAALLSVQPSIVGNLPGATDVLDQIEILKIMGAKIEWLDQKRIKIDAQNINPEKIPADLFEKMRVSVLLVGPLLARFKEFKIPHPGGDKIGLRPIYTHLKALQVFGIEVKEENGFYCFKRPEKIEGHNVVLKEFSVTATEILMMVAATAQGKSKIEIAAAEPQVQDLGHQLEKMGVRIKGIGTHTLEIEGNQNLKGAEFDICPDPLEIGTFFTALAITQGQGKIKNIIPDHLTMFWGEMKEMGVNFEIIGNDVLVKPTEKFYANKIQVLPYPGFPTDLQPVTSVLLTQAQGKSLVHDPLYENRFQHLHELRKMGADIEITDPHRALIFGKTELTGSKINSSDIRSGAALILAGLAAKGETQIENISQIARGYDKIEEKLRKLGAQIEKI